MTIGNFQNTGNGPAIVFTKGRGGSISTTATAVGNTGNGDILAIIAMTGADGTDLDTTAGMILGRVDGSVSTGVVPGKWVFYTANASGTNTEALTLDSSQNATFAGSISIPAADKLYFDGGSDTYIYEESADDLQWLLVAWRC
jgi:hypothetical protein